MRRENNKNYATIEEITDLLDNIVESEYIDRDGIKIRIQDDPKEKEEWARHIEQLEDMLTEMYDKFSESMDGVKMVYERDYEHLYKDS
jgi:Mg2+ and Co2+ transporter CorA